MPPGLPPGLPTGSPRRQPIMPIRLVSLSSSYVQLLTFSIFLRWGKYYSLVNPPLYLSLSSAFLPKF
ncbi:MAG: hypothetical protein N2201_01260 [candidate division WOR-3 bacterium]|nr:hypothetical protein [candidate division WOR-3 bacterium]